MSLSVLGSANLANGGTYTPNAGTANRLMVAVAFAVQSTPPPTLTNIVYNGVTRTPAISNSWSTSVIALGVCLFVNSELSGSAQTVTPTWSGSTVQSRVVCITLDGANQSTTPDATGGPLQVTQTSTVSQGITGATIGDLIIGVSLNRAGVTVTDTTSGWTQLQSALIPSGSCVYDASYHVTAATTDTYALSFTGTSDIVMSLIAIAAGSSGPSVAVLTADNYRRRRVNHI